MSVKKTESWLDEASCNKCAATIEKSGTSYGGLCFNCYTWTAQNLAAALGLEDPEKYREKMSNFCREYGLSLRRTGKSCHAMLKACAYFLNGETVAYYVPTMRAVEPVYNTIRGWLETLHVSYITPRKHLLTYGTGSFTFGSDLQLERSLTRGTDTRAKVFQDYCYWVSVSSRHLCRVLAHSKICASCNKRLRGKELQDARHRRWLIKTYPWEAKTLDAVRRGDNGRKHDRRDGCCRQRTWC